MIEKKPAPRDVKMFGPEIRSWLATLDHTECAVNGRGECGDCHCSGCGAPMGGGYGRCPNRCGETNRGDEK